MSDTETPTPQTPVVDTVPAPSTAAAEAPPAADPPPSHEWGRMRKDLKAANERADEASALVSKLQGQIASMKEQHKGELRNLTERGDLLRHGIDDAPGMAAARAAYAEAGDDRPASIGEWLDGIKTAATAEENPTAPPRWLSSYWTPKAEAPAPKAPGGVKSLAASTQPPPANGAYSDEAIRALVASGDREALAKALAARGAWPGK